MALKAAMKHQLGYDEKLFLEATISNTDKFQLDLDGLSSEHKQFGIFPNQTVVILCDDNNELRTRAQAVEELRLIVDDTHVDILPAVPHVGGLLEFLAHLINDSSFKVSSPALDIVASLIDRFPTSAVIANLQTFISVLARRIGDQSIFIRQTVTGTILKLMKISTPSLVLDSLCKAGLTHRDARIRQETLNFVIIALLIFPCSSFDLIKLAEVVCDLLIDGRRPVRQAALECIAVLAQRMGSSKRQALFAAVDKVSFLKTCLVSKLKAVSA
jgi:hypothetical protein